MKIVEYDTNFKPGSKVKIGFEQTKENKNSGLFKYNQSYGEYVTKNGPDEHVIECKDNTKQYFKTVNIIEESCDLLPGENIVCCQDKECNIGP